MNTFKVVSHLKEGVKVESSTGKFRMLIDEPVELGGTDEAMNPVEALLCSLGSCQCIMARMLAGKMRVDLQDFYVELEGDLDPRGMSGVEGVRPGYQNVRAKFHIKSNDSQEKVQKLVEAIEKYCPIGDTIANEVNLTSEYVID